MKNGKAYANQCNSSLTVDVDVADTRHDVSTFLSGVFCCYICIVIVVLEHSILQHV